MVMAGGCQPALLTITSNRPRASTVRSMVRSMSAGTRTSVAWNSAMPAGGLDFGHGLRGGLRVDVGNDHAAALGGERRRDASTDALGAAGHDCHLVG